MQLALNLLQLLPIQTGTGKNGVWKKQEIVVETQEQYPRKICISLWGDTIDSVELAVGQILKIDFDVESREYNNRWFTSVKAWKIELVQSQSVSEIEPVADNSTVAPIPWVEIESGVGLVDDDVLPF